MASSKPLNGVIFILLVIIFNETTLVTTVQPFKPITDKLNFRAYYRVQPFIRAAPISVGDIYESYHGALTTGLVRQTIQNEASTEEEGVTKYLYDSRGKRVIQFIRGRQQLDDGDELFHDDFYLFENGCTNSYQSCTLSGDAIIGGRRSQNDHYESIKLLPLNSNLDSRLLLAGADDSLPIINLDHFMSDDCLVYLNANLHYITGLSRLLHLIECRRNEFKLQTTSAGDKSTGASETPMASETRGQVSLRYRAKKLEPVATLVGARRAITSLDISVTIPAIDGQQVSDISATLESGVIPLSIMLSFEPDVSILVNVFQFESMGPDEHLSESASAHSSFMMPLAHPDLSNVLYSIQKDLQDDNVYQMSESSFSFQASLSGSLISQVYGDPIEMTMSYDADLMTLSSEMSFIDRTNSDGLDGWSRSTVRQLLDGQSSLRFHLMESNFGYRHGLDYSQTSATTNGTGRGGQTWRTCATNHLASSESSVLLTSGGDLFNLNGAIYMGMALVRGIVCHVYERRLYKLPTILGLSEHDYAHWLAQSNIYLNMYVYESFNDYTRRQEIKFARLQIKLVSKLDQNSIGLSFNLELSSFHWRPMDYIGDGSLSHETLINRMTQDCLLTVPGAGHLDMELWFKRSDGLDHYSGQPVALGRDQARLLRELQRNGELRDHSVTRMLTKTLQISPVQQVGLQSEFLTPKLATNGQWLSSDEWLLYVKLSLYELWNDFVDEEFIGYARDLSFNSRSPATSPIYGLGARSYSYDECKWRTVHSLQPTSFKSEYYRRDDDDQSMMNSLRLFMFCPRRLICILGDPSWLPMRNKRPVKLDDLLEFPYSRKAVEAMDRTPDGAAKGDNDDDVNKCLVSSVIIRQQSLLSKASAMNCRRSKLDWWLTNGRHGSKAATDEEENLVQLRVRELRFQLKVALASQPGYMAAVAANNAQGGATSGGGSSSGKPLAGTDQSKSLLMQVSKLRLSNKKLISNANGRDDDDNNETHDDDDELGHDRSLLVKPLHGLAYLANPAGEASAGMGSENNNNDNHDGGGGAIKPLIVSNLAECSRACLLLHGCRSFSACHQPIGAWPPQKSTAGSAAASGLAGGKISCLFAKLSWSNRSEMNQLVRLVRTKSSTKRPQQQQQQQKQQVSLKVNFNELPASGETPAKVEVHFELSPLCSLHARPQLDLFRLRRSRIEVQPNTRYLMYAKSAEQCARFCQERAQLMRQLMLLSAEATQDKDHLHDQHHQQPAGITGASRSAACNEFYFSADNQYCQLIPKADVWKALRLEHLLESSKRRQQPKKEREPDVQLTQLAAKSALVRRWLEWFGTRTPHETWLDRLDSVYGETEYYELDFEQIFLAHRDQRLTLLAGGAEGGPDDALKADQTMQQRLWHDSATGCAELCLKRKGCRSFGVQTSQAGGGGDPGSQGKRTLCLLNAISARELASQPNDWPSFKLEHTDGARNSTRLTTTAATWWHYEPSELALFMITDPDEPATTTTSASSGDDSAGSPTLNAGVLIQFQSALR